MAWLLLQEQEQGQEEEGWVTALTALAVQAAGPSGDLEEGCRKGNALHIYSTISAPSLLQHVLLSWNLNRHLTLFWCPLCLILYYILHHAPPFLPYSSL